MYVYVYIQIHLHTHICLCIYLHIYIYVNMSTYVYISVCVNNTLQDLYGASEKSPVPVHNQLRSAKKHETHKLNAESKA